MTPTKRLLHSDYTVGLICALPIEMAAAKAMFDEIHADLPNRANDPNFYTLGRIGMLNTIIACLPSGVYGTTSAAVVATQMQCTFSEIQFGLMVGIGGGVPSRGTDIQLGDIVVSNPTNDAGGVVQYDYGKTIKNNSFERTGFLNQPPQVLLNAMSVLQAKHREGFNQIPTYLSEMMAKYPQMKSFAFPGREHDMVFNADYKHTKGITCDNCDPQKQVKRPFRPNNNPVVHYGLIGSGNQVIKDSHTRDRLAQEHGIVCFEMEAAGLMDNFPCLVVRGICDYADSHKNNKWQPYAAATAAAYAKEILLVVSTRTVSIPPSLSRDARDDYTIGWICDLSIEMAASKIMLDEIHGNLPNHPDDQNHYILGRIGAHNIVITCLSPGYYGAAFAQAAVNQMLLTFRSLRLGLVVGLGGGVPSVENDIRLGDVVVGKPTKRFGGLLHWDVANAASYEKFHYDGIYAKPLQLFLTATAKLQVHHIMGDSEIPNYLSTISARYPQMSDFAFPGWEHDLLFNSEYNHVGLDSCDSCDPKEQVIRPSRQINSPVIHYGLIGSGNLIIRSGSARDYLAKKDSILCHEILAAGLGQHFPFLEIRGICDYADSHKYKKWQGYAAATAAAYAKEIVSIIPENVAKKVPTVVSILEQW